MRHLNRIAAIEAAIQRRNEAATINVHDIRSDLRQMLASILPPSLVDAAFAAGGEYHETLARIVAQSNPE
jgi:hypothetical protein